MTFELLCDVGISTLLVVLVGLLLSDLCGWLARIVRILLLVVGFAGCTQCWCGPARASTTETALDELCPGRRELAQHVDTAARRHMLHPVVLVAVMRVESHCRMDVRGRAGEVCAFQVRGVARNGLSRAQLRDPAICIDTGARWLSLMITWAGSLGEGLGAYNTGKLGAGKRYSRKVLAFVARAWRAIERRG